MKLICPFDGEALRRENTQLRCSRNHSFDIARQGYVNLLPVQQKRSKDPGDSKEMVAARGNFLNQGMYRPLAERIADTVLDSPAGGSVCVDAGCGEGYYLRMLAEREAAHSMKLLGLDISKWAVLAAARTTKNITWVVASNAHIPLETDSVDTLMCIFGFPVFIEFNRVVKPGGVVIMADPGAGHLRELREIIYPEVRETEGAAESASGFRLVKCDNVRYQTTLTSQQQIADLLKMTPHLFRAPAEGRQRVAERTELTVTVDVNILTFQR